MDRKIYFERVRADLFNGRLSQGQVDGMNAILDFWEAPPIAPAGAFGDNWNIRTEGWLAYILATTYHETAFTMQPIREFGGDDRLRKLYCNRADLGNGPDNGGAADDGPRFCGRGYVQLTGRQNYTLMSPIVQGFYPDAPDLTVHPDAVMTPNLAAAVLFFGMFNGTFTGKALKNFIGDPNAGQTVDFVNARKIINGLDKAETIAAQAQLFLEALTAADESGPLVTADVASASGGVG